MTDYNGRFEFNGTPALTNLVRNASNFAIINRIDGLKMKKNVPQVILTNHLKICPKCGIIVGHYDERCFSPQFRAISMQSLRGDLLVCDTCQCEFDVMDSRWSLWPYDRLRIVLSNKENINTIGSIYDRISDLLYKSEDADLIR